MNRTWVIRLAVALTAGAALGAALALFVRGQATDGPQTRTSPPTQAPRGSCKVPDDPAEGAALRATIDFLAAPERGGREPGSEGDRQTREYIERRFRSVGLGPAGDDGSYQQRFENEDGAQTANVVGVIRGRDPEVGDEIVVVGAHHDHLGRDGKRLYPGANDNASGVAGLLAVAEALADGPAPGRTVVLAAFGSEEPLEDAPYVEGSDFYVRNPPAGLPTERIVYMVNFDMLGSYCQRRRAIAYGADEGTAAHSILEDLLGRDFDLSVKLGGYPGEGDSDFHPFHEREIPYVYLHTKDPQCLDEPCDTPDRIDIGPMAQLVELAAGLTAGLADAETELAGRGRD